MGVTSREVKLKELDLLKRKVALREGLPHLYGLPWYQWSWDFFNSTNRYNFITAANQIGKDLENDTEIPTPNGFVRMSDLCVGDRVFAQDGTPTEVVAIPYDGVGPGCRVVFSDGSQVICGPGHLWVCKTARERFRKAYRSGHPGREWQNPLLGRWQVLTTEEIIEAGGYAPNARSNWRKVSIPIASPAVGSDKIALFDPYLLGLLIGDGCFRGRSITITSRDPEIVNYVEAHGARKNGQGITWRLPLAVKNEIERLSLFGCRAESKFIPEAYFTATVEERLRLLRGLMDTDGTASRGASKKISFTTVSPRLADDVRTLVCSLGGTVRTKKRKSGYRNREGEHIECQDSYTLSIKLPLNPFALPRKAVLHFPHIRYRHERVIERIEPVGKISSRCITVAHPTGTFLATRDFIVTHNSSTNIRKCIHWATEPSLWPKLWHRRPLVFWYLLPSSKLITQEVMKKWIPEFLPRGEYKNCPQYGWKLDIKNKEVNAIHMNSGVSIYYKSYNQDPQDLQAGTVSALFGDEEMPVDLFPELNMRLAATKGYFHLVFTATLSQEFWRETMEVKGKGERFPDAFKRQVSMYDCLKYMDGTPSHWTLEDIERIKRNCGTEAEIRRRVMGHFVKSEGLKYPSFDPPKNVKRADAVPSDWLIYAGIDSGGGGTSHPAAISFIAVRPDFQKGRVFKHWRGDNVTTTASDILMKYVEMKGNLFVTQARYDYADKDLGVIAQRMGISMMPAEKSHERGEQMLNVLFKNQILDIDMCDETRPLVQELLSVDATTPKQKAQDDSIDSCRYAVVTIPWSWDSIQSAPWDMGQKPKEEVPYETRARLGLLDDVTSIDLGLEGELESYNELYEV